MSADECKNVNREPTKPLSCSRGSCCAAVLKSNGSAMTHGCWDSLFVYLPLYIHVNIYVSRIPCTYLCISDVEHQSEYDRHHIFLHVQKYTLMIFNGENCGRSMYFYPSMCVCVCMCNCVYKCAVCYILYM